MTIHSDDRASRELPSLVESFIEQFRSTILATLSETGGAQASYAPFVQCDNNFYVYISQLAAHSANLRVNPACEMLLIEDEAKSTNLFARKRLTIACQATVIARNSEEFTTVLAAFRDRCGPVIRMLESLPDFTLFRLTPSAGMFVQGFGNAQAVSFQ